MLNSISITLSSIKIQPTNFHCDLINCHVLTSTFLKCHVAAPAKTWDAVAGLAAG